MNGSTPLTRLLVVAGTIGVVAGATPAGAQGLDKYARPLIVEVRSADSARAARVTIVAEGDFLLSVGVQDPEPGSIPVSGDRVRVQTPALLEFGDATGRVSLTAERGSPAMLLIIRAGNTEDARTLARGYAIQIAGDSLGRIRVGVPALTTIPARPPAAR